MVLAQFHCQVREEGCLNETSAFRIRLECQSERFQILQDIYITTVLYINLQYPTRIQIFVK